MSILRVLVTAAPGAAHGVPWALYDDQGRLVRSGAGPVASWPGAVRREAVLAASVVRIVRIVLPPMPADRVAAAAAYALEDRLAGPAQAQHLVTSMRQRDGNVDVAIAARDLFAPLARDFARVVAEPAVAPTPPARAWRWYASAAGDTFIRRADGSAFAVPSPREAAPLPPELILAIAHAARTPPGPARIEVAFPATDAALAAWSEQAGIAFERSAPWRWDQDANALAAATDLLQGDFARTPKPAPARVGRAFRVAGGIAVAAVLLHVAATFAQWAALRFESWQVQRAIVAAARDAGAGDAGARNAGADNAGASSADMSDAGAAAVALRNRFVRARQGAGRPAPGDALPLLARAAPSLSHLPAGTLKSATYAAGTWTLDLARLDPAIAARLDSGLAGAGIATLAAPNASGIRMRLSPAPGTELP